MVHQNTSTVSLSFTAFLQIVAPGTWTSFGGAAIKNPKMENCGQYFGGQYCVKSYQ